MDVKQTLERLTPETEQFPHWDAVLRDARPSRVRWAAPRLAVLGAVLGLAAVVAVAPWRSGERTGVLDRALAAVDGGPVLHVVVREGWGGDLVDLKTGDQRPLRGEREVWYDPNRGLHSVSRFGGVLQSEQLWGPGDAPRFEAKTFSFLAEGYRSALESGRAKVLGRAEVDGVPVYWIRVDAELLPEGERVHEWAHDVAVSRDSFEPVATRETRDGVSGPDGISRILELEMLAAGEGDFSKSGQDPYQGKAFSEEIDELTLAKATEALGSQPLWLGSEHSGMRLAQVALRKMRIGTQQETELTGPDAAEIKACVAQMDRGRARRRRPDCLRRLRRGFQIREGKVLLHGRVVWGDEHEAIQLLYIKGEAPRRPVPALAAPDIPHVLIRETTDPHPGFFRGAHGYTPEEGSLVMFGRFANLKRDGVYIAIEAASEELLLSAARALRPLSAGSGAGG